MEKKGHTTTEVVEELQEADVLESFIRTKVIATNNKSKVTNDVCTEIAKQTQIDECQKWGVKRLRYQIKEERVGERARKIKKKTVQEKLRATRRGIVMQPD